MYGERKENREQYLRALLARSLALADSIWVIWCCISVNRSSSTVRSLVPPVTGTRPARPDAVRVPWPAPVVRLVGGALTARVALCGTLLVESMGARGLVKGGGPRVVVTDPAPSPLT